MSVTGVAILVKHRRGIQSRVDDRLMSGRHTISPVRSSIETSVGKDDHDSEHEGRRHQSNNRPEVVCVNRDCENGLVQSDVFVADFEARQALYETWRDSERNCESPSSSTEHSETDEHCR